MGHHQHRDVKGPVEGGQGLHQIAGPPGVQRAGGLVGQQQVRPGRQGPGAGAPLPLSPGDLVGEFVQQRLDLQPPGQLPDLEGDLLPGPPLEGHGQGDVLPQGEGVQEVVVLEDEAQTLPAEAGHVPVRDPGQILAAQADPPGGGPVNGGDHVQQGGLAAPRRPHDGPEAPPGQTEAHAVHRRGLRPAAVGLGHVFQLKQGFHRRPPRVYSGYKLRPGLKRAGSV